jgi:hypothetical protein
MWAEGHGKISGRKEMRTTNISVTLKIRGGV